MLLQTYAFNTNFNFKLIAPWLSVDDARKLVGAKEKELLLVESRFDLLCCDGDAVQMENLGQ